jgi:hypothetical protein
LASIGVDGDSSEDNIKETTLYLDRDHIGVDMVKTSEYCRCVDASVKRQERLSAPASQRNHMFYPVGWKVTDIPLLRDRKVEILR